MNGAISYSLFGFNKPTPDNCFEFSSYLRGLHINIRFNRIIYPGWTTVLGVDEQTFKSPYGDIIKWHQDKGYLKVDVYSNDDPLCKAMLWRLRPVFHYHHPDWTYSHVLCRDLDSIATYREAQMVYEWISEDKTIHCITDSVSHNIPMMGGMIGIRVPYFVERVASTWERLLDYDKAMDFTKKGSDQTFLNRAIYPKCADSATEHYIKGMVHNLPEGNGRHYKVKEDQTIGVDERFKSTNYLCGHVGAAGYYEAPTMKFLNYEDPFKEDYKQIESKKEFRNIFYWHG